MIKVNSIKQKYEAYLSSIVILLLSLLLFLTLGLFSLINWQNTSSKLVELKSQLTVLMVRKSAIDRLAPQITTLTVSKSLIDGVLPTDY